MEVSLYDILSARETRVRLQQQMLQEYKCPIICFTMNIAGPIKNTPLIQRGFQAGMDALSKQIPTDWIRKKIVESAPTGDTAIYAVQMDADKLKNICQQIEDSTPLGRLFDMDVIDLGGKKLERSIPRNCIVCGALGRGCAARRIHSVTELQNVTQQILKEHFETSDPDWIASKAVQSLIDEVNTTPKPGLVDQRNNGSHKDMTLQHFLDSANALLPYFRKCVKIGQENRHLSPGNTFPLLRQAGLEAEKVMYQATGGVNTHKGAIYTMGILCGSIGRLWTAEKPVEDISKVLTECSALVQESAKSDLASANGTTAGEQTYLQYGIGGIRTEVAAGLPSVANIAIPCYQKALEAGLSQNNAGFITLLHLISNVEDTNLYHRGGKAGATWASAAASALLTEMHCPTFEKLAALDDAFIARNLSPGGCADLLAVTYFLHSLST